MKWFWCDKKQSPNFQKYKKTNFFLFVGVYGRFLKYGDNFFDAKF